MIKWEEIMKHLSLSMVAVGLMAMLPTMSQAGSRQLGTGAVTQLEGSSGSGLVPWATIAGYGEAEEFDWLASFTRVDTGDYRFDMQGVAVGWNNRFEVSFAKQELDLLTLGPAIGLSGATLNQDVIGAKFRLAGNLVYSKMPQIALGFQYKKNTDFLIPSVVGARDDSGLDIYLSATKLFLSKPAGFNGFATLTLRSTEGNEMGLLGFGGDRGSRDINAEASVGMFLNSHWAVGIDFRQKQSKLNFAKESHWKDLFVAWVPNRHVSVVVAYADLRNVATLSGQEGWYLSVNGGF